MTIKQLSRRCIVMPSRAVLAMSLLLAGCAQTPPKSIDSLQPVDDTATKRIQEILVRESQKLQAAQQALADRLEQQNEPEMPELLAPEHDPLEDVQVSVSLRSAPLASLFQILAEQGGFNLLVEPEVLDLDLSATLYLNDVSARELYDYILNTFDLYGEVKGRTIRIGLYEEKVLSTDFLNSSVSLDVSSGGAVLGGTSDSNSADALGSLSVQGGVLQTALPYEEFEKGLEHLLGKEGGQQKRQEGSKSRQDNAGKVNQGVAYTLNRSSGTLYLRARPSQVAMVEKLLTRHKEVLNRQVLIEAQLLDVQLSDQFRYGVDWQLLRSEVAGVMGGTAMALDPALTSLPDASMPLRGLSLPAQTIGNTAEPGLNLVTANSSTSVALELMRSFGNVKLISNPSIRVRNNTPAMLSVGSAASYISETDTTVNNPGGGASTTSVDIQTDTVFSGVMIGVVPMIAADGSIELLVNPMQTEVDEDSLTLIDVGGGNKVSLPRVSYKGMMTTLKGRNGDTIILGGLIDQKTGDNNQGVPGLSDVPLLGKAFDKEYSTHSSRELVIVLTMRLI
ncbi:MAG: pilus (MSHA type) biogenesis protein MshL [Marinobacterium sp.]